MTAPVVVRAVDDGAVEVWRVDAGYAARLRDWVGKEWRRRRDAGLSWPSELDGLLRSAACSGPAAALSARDTPPVPAAAVELLFDRGASSWSVAEAAELLGVGERHVRKLRAAGRLRPAGRGRVLAVDVARREQRRS